MIVTLSATNVKILDVSDNFSYEVNRFGKVEREVVKKSRGEERISLRDIMVPPNAWINFLTGEGNESIEHDLMVVEETVHLSQEDANHRLLLEDRTFTPGQGVIQHGIDLFVSQ